MRYKINIISKLIFICLIIGFLSGSTSAFFLVSLEWVTQYRIRHFNIFWLLPLGGLFIGFLYHYYGKEVVKGNNLLLEAYVNSRKSIPFRMAPIVLISTLTTHLLGGSAGREGTGVQMSAAIAYQFKTFFNFNSAERRILIVSGISAGFASVFGTPLAGALFSLEILNFSKICLKTIIFSFFTAYIAYYTVEFWQVEHTNYFIPLVPDLTWMSILYCVLAGIIFGFASFLFSANAHFWADFFSKYIKFSPLRPFIGGLILCFIIYFFQPLKFLGLGINEIKNAFSIQSEWYDFILKILFTGFTLGAGFKGGEVTPLFFVGATLGSALSFLIPLPMAILAGMGFVAVFSGAAHTPISCAIMGIELFGIQSFFYIAIACLIAYFSSGMNGIYKSQKVNGIKFLLYQHFKNSTFKHIHKFK